MVVLISIVESPLAHIHRTVPDRPPNDNQYPSSTRKLDRNSPGTGTGHIYVAGILPNHHQAIGCPDVAMLRVTCETPLFLLALTHPNGELFVDSYKPTSTLS
jgi:hypothetical protein